MNLKDLSFEQRKNLLKGEWQQKQQEEKFRQDFYNKNEAKEDTSDKKLLFVKACEAISVDNRAEFTKGFYCAYKELYSTEAEVTNEANVKATLEYMLIGADGSLCQELNNFLNPESQTEVYVAGEDYDGTFDSF